MGQGSVQTLRDATGNELPGRLIEVAGHDAYVVDAGSGPCILLLHGYGDSCQGWRRVIPALATDHRVIAIDLPGFGRSRRPRSSGGLIDHYSVFFSELAATMGVEHATVVGHSLGGAVALTLALEQPNAIDRLALIAPAGLGDAPPWWWHAIAGTYVNWQAMLQLPNPLAKGVIRGTMRSFLTQRLVYDPRQLEHLIEDFVDKHGGRKQLAELIGTGRSLISGYDGSLLERARRGLPMPVSVIWGSQDRLADPAHAGAFAASVPHAEVHLLERCGHYPQMEFPMRVNELLREFAD
jgi:pimeloyl-ACP methyl ester carboxylesterase